MNHHLGPAIPNSTESSTIRHRTTTNSTTTKKDTTTIKAGYTWQATAYTVKQMSSKWRLVIQEGRYTHHGPQEVPEAQRGWAHEAKQPPASEAKSRRHGVADGYTLKFKANG
jgi:hypothetical protein